MSVRMNAVLAGVVVPNHIPKAIGIQGWSEVIASRIANADAVVVLREQNNPQISLLVAETLQQMTAKPAFVRLLVRDMNRKQLEDVLKEAAKKNIRGIFISQGYHGKDGDFLSIEKALSIFTRMFGGEGEAQKPIVACPVPLPTMKRTQDESFKMLEERIHEGAELLFIPPWQDPLSVTCYLEEFAEKRRALPEVMQTICPIETKEQVKVIQSLAVPVSPSHRSVTDFSLKSEAASLRDLFRLSKESVPLAGTYANLTLSDNYEEILARVKKLSITEKMT